MLNEQHPLGDLKVQSISGQVISDLDLLWPRECGDKKGTPQLAAEPDEVVSA
jgi:hypothetical protein